MASSKTSHWSSWHTLFYNSVFLLLFCCVLFLFVCCCFCWVLFGGSTNVLWYHCPQYTGDLCSWCWNCGTVTTSFLHTVVAARERLVLHEEWGWDQFSVHLVFAEIRIVPAPEDHMLAGYYWLGRTAQYVSGRAVVRSCCYYTRRSGLTKQWYVIY